MLFCLAYFWSFLKHHYTVFLYKLNTDDVKKGLFGGFTLSDFQLKSYRFVIGLLYV